MPDNLSDLSVVIPVFNESHEVIDKIINDFRDSGAEVIVVDDGSLNPYPSAIKHGINQGYGSALMTGIKNATRPIILTIDGDGQHGFSESLKLYKAYKLIENADMVIGVRKLKHEKLLRFLGRKFLNWTASLLCSSFIPDLNSGARIFKRDLAIGYFPILCRTFSFTTSITISMMADKYNVEFFPIKVEDRVHGSSHVKVVKHGIITLYYIIRNSFALRTRRIRSWKRNLFSR